MLLKGKRDIPKHRYMTDIGQKGLFTCVVARRLDWDMVQRDFKKKERYYASVLRGVVRVGDRS